METDKTQTLDEFERFYFQEYCPRICERAYPRIPALLASIVRLPKQVQHDRELKAEYDARFNAMSEQDKQGFDPLAQRYSISGVFGSAPEPEGWPDKLDFEVIEQVWEDFPERD